MAPSVDSFSIFEYFIPGFTGVRRSPPTYCLDQLAVLVRHSTLETHVSSTHDRLSEIVQAMRDMQLIGMCAELVVSMSFVSLDRVFELESDRVQTMQLMEDRDTVWTRSFQMCCSPEGTHQKDRTPVGRRLVRSRCHMGTDFPSPPPCQLPGLCRRSH